MIITIALILAFLVAINFVLLFTSCNKTQKEENSERLTHVIKINKPLLATKQLDSGQLVATGS